MTNTCATGCGTPTQNTLCPTCLQRLTSSLRRIATGGLLRTRTHTRGRGEHATTYQVPEYRPGLFAELFTTIARQDVLTRTTTGHSSETPLLFKAAASEVRWLLDNTITVWAKRLVDANPDLTVWATGTAGTAEWMAGYPGRIAVHPDAGEMYDEIMYAVNEVLRAIDRGPEKIYLGICRTIVDAHGNPAPLDAAPAADTRECGAEIHGHVDKPTTHCKACGTEYDAHERWRETQDRVRSSLATAAEIAGAVARIYGRQLNVKTIRTWAQRGVIETHGRNERGEPMHNVGEVLDTADRRVRWKRPASCA